MLSTLVQSGTISLTIGWIDMKLCTNIHVPLKLTLTFGFYSLIELLSTNVDSRFNCVLDWKLPVFSCECLLEAVLLIDAVPDLPGLWSSVAREALWVEQQVDVLRVR